MTKTEQKLDKLAKKLEKTQSKVDVQKKKTEIKQLKKSARNITTTKFIVGFIFVNCSAVEIYSMIAMWMLNDLSALYALISAVIGEAISFAVYAAKAYHESKQEALVDLEYEKLSYEYEDNGEEGNENILNSEPVNEDDAEG